MKYETARMLSLFSAIIFACVLLLTTQATLAQQAPVETKGEHVSVQYDQQQDVTKVTMNPFVLVSRKQEELRMGAVTAYQGKAKTYPKEIALLFMSLSAADTNKYESARKVSITIDGERLALGEASRSKQTQNGIFVEMLMLKISTDVFVRLSRAKSATIKLGFTQVPLTPAHFNILRVTVSYLTE